MSAPPPLEIDAVEIREVGLPLRRAHRSGSSSLDERRLLLIALRSGNVIGRGECGPIPGYSMETLGDCKIALDSLARRLVDGLPPGHAAPPTARFAVDAALADLRGNADGSASWRTIGGATPEVAVGAVIGLDADGAGLVEAATTLAAAGYQRVKLKVAPNRCRERARALRGALPDTDLAVDANGTFAPGEDDELRAIDDLGLAFIEQPHPPQEADATAALASHLTTPVCLDESIIDLQAAAVAISMGIPWVFNVKPARVGGLGVAALITSMAAAAGIEVWCGGMLESGVGKAAALAVATLRGMTMPADLGPSVRHFETDLMEWSMDEGTICVTESPGLGIEIDGEALERFTVGIESIGEGF
jgi:O-succinylbenzoate synthase